MLKTSSSHIKEPIRKSTEGTLLADSFARIYKRLLQGAWVRSGASVFMWLFGLIAYTQENIEGFAFLGVSISVLYLILINPPTLWILKGIRQKKSIAVLSLCLHGLEVFGYTAIIYFAGGMGRGYLTLLYAALITYVGVMSPRRWSFIVTAWCSLTFFGMIVLEYFKLIPDTSLSVRLPVPYSQQFLDVIIMTSGLLVVAFISFYTSGKLRRGRQQLKMQNESLKEVGDRLEQARNNLLEKNLALERAMERALASDQMKSEFLANMSHELRTPLNHIIGFTELVSDRAVGPLNATQEEFLNDVLSSSRHLLSLISDILDLSKVEAGKMNLETSEISLESLLRASLQMVKEETLKHRIALTPRFQEIPSTIRGDERKLKQILYNLLSNAVKFTPDGGRVELAAQGLDGRGVEIAVHDTGIGLETTDLERIFQPFEQGDNSIGRKYQGTGLGLALTRKMVSLHGGRIWAESPGSGRGATFHVILPLQPECDV
jgi:signal transduction histidine kinase